MEAVAPSEKKMIMSRKYSFIRHEIKMVIMA